jgi:probable rRNA maturation factor
MVTGSFMDERATPNSEPETHLLIAHTHSTLRLDEDALRRLIACVVEAEARTVRYLGIILADHETVLDLNRTYLAHDYLTDVLSFSLAEAGDDALDGEVYVDLDTAAEQHETFGTSFEEEAQRYVVHGLLHLMGYDDAAPAAQHAMRRLEDHYLVACSGV